jgi:hypothetical protein
VVLAQVTGLRPATTYQVVVTAYINRQSTASTPVTFTTAARGPDPPAAVQTRTDAKGDWVVSWAPCTAASCYVPADSWNVVGAACGSGFVGQPPAVEVPAGQTSVTIDAATLGLLGDSLTFAVQGVLASGLTGNPTSDHTCTQAWRPADPADLALTGAGVPNPVTRTITATLQVSIRGAATIALGSQSTEFVYSVGEFTVGPTTNQTVTVPGLAAGAAYTPSVRVYPSGHLEAAVLITGPSFRQDLTWPAGIALVVSPRVNPNPDTATIELSFPGLPPGPFVAAGPPVTCGSTQAGSPVGGPLVDGALTIRNFDLVNMGGNDCHLAVTLTDTATPNPYGVSSPQLQAGFGVGVQPGYQFTAKISQLCQHSFCGPGQQQIEVDYAGPQPAVLKAGGDWSIQTGPGSCAAAYPVSQLPPSFPQVLTLPGTCHQASRVEAVVSYRYLGHTFLVPTGPPSGAPGTTTTTTSTTTSTTSTTSTTAPGGTTTSTTHVAAAATLVSEVRGDADVRTALLWTPVAGGAVWLARSGLRRRRRRKPQ